LLDGFEDLLALTEPAGGVTRLLGDIFQAAPGVKVVATSRTCLHMEGELVIYLGGLKVPPRATCSGAEQYSAVQLFLTAVRREHPDFRPTGDDLAAVVRVCRLLDGLPLGILLAAAWMEMLTPGEIAAQVSGTTGQALGFLQAEWRDVPLRQRSMRAVLDHSYELLTEQEQSTLRDLSIFRGGFTACAAREVAGASLRTLRALVDKSRLHRTPSGRYALHELVRLHALEKVEASPDAGETVRNCHSAVFASALRSWWPELHGSGQGRALAEMGAEAENLRLAWQWAAEHQQVAQLDESMDGLCTFYEWTGRYAEGERACQRAYEALAAQQQSLSASADGLQVQARVLAWQGGFVQALGRTNPADELLQRSLRMLESPALAEQDTRLARAFVLWRLGNVTLEANAANARCWYEQSQALYQTLGDRWGQATAADALGQAAAWLGYQPAAKQAYRQSLAWYQALGDQRGMLSTLRPLSDAADYEGQGKEPEPRPGESDSLAEETDAPNAAASVLQEVGSAMSMGRYAEAQGLLEQEVRVQKITEDTTSDGLLSLAQAVIQAHLGRYGEARDAAQRCLTLCREADCQWAIQMCCRVEGMIALALGAYAEAEDWLQQSIVLCRQTGQWDDLGLGQAYLALAEQGLGKLAEASEQLGEALRRAVSTEVNTLQLQAVQAMALLLVAQGALERAVELQALVLRYPAVANSQWCHTVCIRHIAAAAVALPPAVLEAAQARGRARGLRATVTELVGAFDLSADVLPRERCQV
jgi:predicted ATPase